MEPKLDPRVVMNRNPGMRTWLLESVVPPLDDACSPPIRRGGYFNSTLFLLYNTSSSSGVMYFSTGERGGEGELLREISASIEVARMLFVTISSSRLPLAVWSVTGDRLEDLLLYTRDEIAETPWAMDSKVFSTKAFMLGLPHAASHKRGHQLAYSSVTHPASRCYEAEMLTRIQLRATYPVSRRRVRCLYLRQGSTPQVEKMFAQHKLKIAGNNVPDTSVIFRVRYILPPLGTSPSSELVEFWRRKQRGVCSLTTLSLVLRLSAPHTSMCVASDLQSTLFY